MKTEAASVQSRNDEALPNVLDLCRSALGAAERLVESARYAVGKRVLTGNKADGAAMETHQFAAHGYAWLATCAAALRQMLHWTESLARAGHFSALEQLMLQIAFGEYLAQMAGGIAMSQTEVVRPSDIGLEQDALDAFRTRDVGMLIARGNTAAARTRLWALLATSGIPDDPLEDETLALVRNQFRRFAAEKIAPHAQDWHRGDMLIPLELIHEMAELGVFGLTLPEEWGGLAMGKRAMCIVTEELSRASLAVGSL
ncbi:MAG TPA: acyl-CoA dehydrogenase family protein, partial [Alphaproteobacteria bacterium]|nr:acyl-CoA dehydrogenase family protein [Alphaproteobacteria bacterium]